MATIESKKTRKRKVRKSKTMPGSEHRVTDSQSQSHSDCTVHCCSRVQPNGNGEPFVDAQLSLPVLEMQQNSDKLEATTADNGDSKQAAMHCDQQMDDLDGSPSPDPLVNNPYLNREKCLLCQCERSALDFSESEDESLPVSPHKSALSQWSLWVCPKCKAGLEEEERKGLIEPSFLDQEIETNPNTLKFLEDLGKERSDLDSKTCSCEACKDRKQIEAQQEEENAELQSCWIELRNAIRYLYRERMIMKSFECVEPVLTRDRLKENVFRLCQRDAHQLFQRLESQAREYILEVKVRLLQQLTSGHKTPAQARAFVSLMLEEYGSLCSSAKALSDIFNKLEQEHLRRFSFTWELHDKHLFQNIIYVDPLVQNSLPMLITQLRLGAASKEPYHEDCFPHLLHRYLKFDDEMAVVGVVWRDCQQRLDRYVEEQNAIQAKQQMLKEDWEFFKTQRKILEQKVQKSREQQGDGSESAFRSTAATSCLETQFSDAMRNILHGVDRTKPFVCPSCNRQRCPCDECSISHIITCGILPPEVQDTLLPGPHGKNPFQITQTQRGYDLSIKPPSVSSDSTSDACSDGEDQSGFYDDSDDSWDEKYKRDPNYNPFEEFLIENCKEPSTSPSLYNGESKYSTPPSSTASSISDNNEACQCHVCQQPAKGAPADSSDASEELTKANTGDLSKLSVQVTQHLYPHIHGSQNLASMHLGSTGGPLSGLTTAQYKSLLQPQLYELHNPTAPATIRHAQTTKQWRKRALNLTPGRLGVSSFACIKNQLKMNGSVDRSKVISGLPTGDSDFDDQPIQGVGPYGGFLLPESQAAYSNSRLRSTDLLHSPPPPFMCSDYRHGDLNISSISEGLTARKSAFSPAGSTLQWDTSGQVMPSCLLAYPHAGENGVPHKHDDACFKRLPGPINHTASTTMTANLTADSLGKIMNRKPPTSTTNSISTASDSHHFHTHSVPSSTHSHQVMPNSNKSTTAANTCQHNGVIKPKLPPVRHEISTKTPESVDLNKNPNNHHHSNSGTTASSQHHHHHGINPTTASQQLGEIEGGDSDDNDDGSCSGQSSSTSASNQKDSKYCDCCYCEFFGHATPAPAPTSKNYPEIRERLRLRLKKKKTGCTNSSVQPPKIPNKPITAAVTVPEIAKVPETVVVPAYAEVDDLVKYITGEEVTSAERSTKLDKKTRKKLKKLEQKARKHGKTKNQDKGESKTNSNNENSDDETDKSDEEEEEKSASDNESDVEIEFVQQISSRKKQPLTDEAGKRPQQPLPQANHKISKVGVAMPSATHFNNKTHPQPLKVTIIAMEPERNRAALRLHNNLHETIDTLSSGAQQSMPNCYRSKLDRRKEEMNKRNEEKSNAKLVTNNNRSEVDTPATPVKHKGKLHFIVNEKRMESGLRQQPEGEEHTLSNQSHTTLVNGTLSIPNYLTVTNKEATSQRDNNTGALKKRPGKPDVLDDVFLPKDDTELEEVNDTFERELNEFKRFCLKSPLPKTKIAVNVNVKDLLNKKKVAC